MRFITYSSTAILLGFVLYAPNTPTRKAIDTTVTVISRPLSYSFGTAKMSANVRAFLYTIRYAEGTSGTDGYRIIYTGEKFSSFDRHPDRNLCATVRGRRLCSTAAGAYQYLTTTWNATAKRIGAKDFSPANQDLGAIDLIKNAGALELVEAGKFEEAVYKVSPIWASLPNRAGSSVYEYTGQSARSMTRLKAVYQKAGGKFSH